MQFFIQSHFSKHFQGKIQQRIVLITLLWLLVIWVITYYELNQTKASYLREAEVRTSVQARVFAENTRSIIKRINEISLNSRAHWDGDWKAFANVIRQRQESINDITFQVAVIDKHGKLAFSNLASATDRTDLSDREHFKVHQVANGQDRLFISKPLLGKISGKWSIQFTRPILRHGQFDGVLVVSVSPDLFAVFPQTLGVAQSSAVSIVRDTGEVLSRFPKREGALSVTIDNSPYLLPDAPKSGNFSRASQIDGVPRIFGFYRATEYGLNFVVAESIEEALKPYTNNRNMVLFAASQVSVLTIFLFFILMRSMVAADKLRKDLESEKVLAQQASEAKSQFLANMSHEIRTPMNGVLGMTQLLLEKNLRPDERELALNIQHSADALLSIINDILDLSKIEAGHMFFDEQVFTMESLMHVVIPSLKLEAQEKGIDLRVSMLTPPNTSYLGDSLRIQQVLINLLGNAVKFTQEGSVSLTIYAIDQGVHFEVLDTGIGIPADALGRIFSSFAQVDASTSRQYGGTGLGLVISKRLVEGMKGMIGVDSKVGQGSCFWFELPLRKVDVQERTVQPTSAQTTQLRRFKFLLVEDHPMNQRLALTMLESLGGHGDLAVNGQAAVDAAAQSPYDIIFMDVQMPVMNGVEATELIRASQGINANTPIIALTANAMKTDQDKYMQAGMSALLTKPFTKASLRQIIQTHLHQFEHL